MKGRRAVWAAVFAFVPWAGGPAAAGTNKCPIDSVQVGPVCVDAYEASVWSIAASERALIGKLKKGKIKSAAELAAATRHGAASDDYGPGCPDDGNGCTDYYALSIPGVVPSGHVNWFQALAACRNAGKRLPTNQEWQMAALGTPDIQGGVGNGTTDCNTFELEVADTGARSSCVSDVGAFDLVGNLTEWVAEWVPSSSLTPDCPGWGAFSADAMCLTGASETAQAPGVLNRGGSFEGGVNSGVFAVHGWAAPTVAGPIVGFRCARDL